MNIQIGYFIPEFPGQTHIFFWRERQILTELGIQTRIISTRRPPKAISSHVWADEAQKTTFYLTPFSFQEVISTSAEILRAGFVGWTRCLKVIADAQDVSFLIKLRLFALIFVAGKLARIAREEKWSHIHVHSCADAANIAMLASRLTGLTYSMTHLGPTLETYGPNQSQKWKYAAFAVIESERLFKHVNEKLSDLPKQMVISPMGVNLSNMSRRTAYVPWDQDSVCKIFSCGRLNPVKGHKYLIETIKLLRQQGYDAVLKIAGEDEQGGDGYHRELEEFINTQGMTEYVELLGAISEDKISQCLEEAHIFALASLNEGTSIAIMEAMAMGTPTVVTNVGGTPDLVSDGVDGILVEPEDPQEMANTIVKILLNPELRLMLSQASQKKITEQYHHRRSAQMIASCLENLCESKK